VATSARAVWFVEPRHAELREEAVGAPGEREVRVTALVSLVSAGTEMIGYRGEVASPSEVDLPTRGGEFPFPLKFAYQVVGRVEEAGPESGFAAGDTVFCYHPHQERFTTPVAAGGGNELATGAWPLVFRVPDDLDVEKAAFANLFCVAYNCLLDVPVRIGDCVVVSGLGVIGSICAFLARTTADRLVLVDPLEARRERARWIGADAVVHPAEAADAIAELFEGRGADVYVEASGAPAAVQAALAGTGQEGTIGIVSYYGKKPVTVVLSPEFHLRRQRIVSSMVSSIGSGLQPRWSLERRMAVAMRRLRTLEIGNLVTHRIPFDDAVRAYELIDTHPEDSLGVLLDYRGAP